METIRMRQLEEENARLRHALKDVIDFRGAKGAWDWINDERTTEAFRTARKLLDTTIRSGKENSHVRQHQL